MSTLSTGRLGLTALIMAGGTGGHIFPGLAVAQALRDRGWNVVWLGGVGGMEVGLVTDQGFALETIEFSGLRGKGPLALALLPLRLLKAFWQSLHIIRRIKPDVLLGFGGYVTFPGAMMGVLLGTPLLLHEQNSVAGLANKVLAGISDRIFTAFPNVLKKAQWVGNPLRSDFLTQASPEQRFAERTGPLRLLVLGGSLGAKALNEIVPQALALLPENERPLVCHQSGVKQLDAAAANYHAAGVAVDLTAFIDNTALAFANADLIICRAGASTVTEIAAVGAAAIFVPYPFAVDDHQTQNAELLVKQGGGWLLQQSDLSAQGLAHMLQTTDRAALLARAKQAKTMEKINATRELVAACEELVA